MEEQEDFVTDFAAPDNSVTTKITAYTAAMTQREVAVIDLNCFIVIAASIFAVCIICRSQRKRSLAIPDFVYTPTLDVEDGRLMGEVNDPPLFSSDAIVEAERARRSSLSENRRRSIDSANIFPGRRSLDQIHGVYDS